MDTPDPNEAERQRIYEMCVRACEQIGEHVDSVRVFATFTPGNGKTVPISVGRGNWYASYGQVMEWLQVEDARTIEQSVTPDDE